MGQCSSFTGVITRRQKPVSPESSWTKDKSLVAADDGHQIRAEFAASAAAAKKKTSLSVNVKVGAASVNAEAEEDDKYGAGRTTTSLGQPRSRSRSSSFSDDSLTADVPGPPLPLVPRSSSASSSSGASSAISRFGSIFVGGASSNNKRPSPAHIPGIGIVGLSNLGNTCFMNSALQCLSNTAPLVDYFLESNWKSKINYHNPIGFQGKIAQAFGTLISEMWTHDCKSPVVKSLTMFKRELGKVRPQFSGYLQHDSQELIVFLLDGLHEDLNQVESKPYVEDVEYDGKAGEDESIFAKKAWEGHLLRNRSIIVDISQGQLKSTLTCSKCLHTSIKYEPFMYLSLPVPTSAHRRKGADITLSECLAEFCKEEELSGYCQWYCPCCKVHVDATKQLKIWSLPDILIVHLKRFEQEGMYRRTKINALVDFPTRNLDLYDFLAQGPVSSGAHGRGGLYDLYAVSNHHGGLDGGHYTAMGKNRMNRRWYRYDDSAFREVSEEDACSSSAYVLFYQKVGVRALAASCLLTLRVCATIARSVIGRLTMPPLPPPHKTHPPTTEPDDF